MGSKKVAKRPGRRGPKTAEGRLAVRLNASKHGILSPEPVVAAYERPQDWEAHREAVVGSLAPEGGGPPGPRGGANSLGVPGRGADA